MQLYSNSYEHTAVGLVEFLCVFCMFFLTCGQYALELVFLWFGCILSRGCCEFGSASAIAQLPNTRVACVSSTPLIRYSVLHKISDFI